MGFGTYRLGQHKSRLATLEALKKGYRLIDTAFVYGGQTIEIEVGKAIQDALQADGVIQNRDEVFVTTKQWRTYHGYEQSLKCLEKSLERLGLDYVDCWLIHWPGPCWNVKPKQEKEKDQRGTKRDRASESDEDDPWVYAKVGMGEDEIASLRAETWRAMEDAYRQGKARECFLYYFISFDNMYRC